MARHCALGDAAQAVCASVQLVKVATEEGVKVQLIIYNAADSTVAPLVYQLHPGSVLRPARVGRDARLPAACLLVFAAAAPAPTVQL
jgi:hypothetical protein